MFMESTIKTHKFSESLAEEARKQRTLKRLNRLFLILTIVFSVVLITVVVMVLNRRFDEPKTYYEYQLQVWNQALYKKPKDPTARTRLAQLHMKMDNDAKAEAKLRAAIKDTPKFMSSYYYLALIYQNRDDLKGAEKNLLKAISLTKNDNVKALPAFRLAGIYEEMGKTAKAIKYYELTIAGEPLMWNAYGRLGAIYEKKGELKTALQYYEGGAIYNAEDQKLKKTIEGIKKKLGNQ